MKNRSCVRRPIFQLLPLLLVPWLAGCETAKEVTITGHMWEATGSNHREPAQNANLKLYHTSDRKDVLVRYDEERESSGTVKSRAFLLMANQGRINAGRKPSFLSGREAAKVQADHVRIISENDVGEMNDEELAAIVSRQGRHFTLISKGREIGSYDLPTYLTSSRAFVERALFLPATVIGDVAVYGTLIGGYAGLEYLSTLNQNSGASHANQSHK